MDPQLLAKYDRPVPRYTSYPTAPHFHPGIGAGDYAAWLDALAPGAALSFYLHVPFCDTLCWFCGCHTRIVRRYELVAAYAALMTREIELVAGHLGPGHEVDHLHFGGGSPTILKPADIDRLFGMIWQHVRPTATAEIAVEVDPRDLADDSIAAFAAAGVNRASIGVQDANPEVQRAINRVQPAEVTASAVERLRANGISAINLDLMYGLPLQTVERVLATVDSALALAPDRVALFGYAHVPQMKKHQELLLVERLPAAEERWAQAEAAAARLAEAGYVRIGLDHFARPEDPMARALAEGRLHRNFQGYTTDAAAALIGVGASAIGALPQGYVQNAVKSPDYREAISAGRLATMRGVAIDDDDRLRRDIIEAIMCELEVDLGRYPAADGFEAERAALLPLAADGLIEVEGDHLRVTERGRPFVRVAAAAFDRYLRPDEQRHSRAV